MEEKQSVIGIGEALFDVLPEGKKLGGAPANFAYHVSPFGLESCAVSAMGDDELGKELRATGVDFKFFGQANWGIEFKGKDNSHLISTESEVFGIGDGNGHDNGNVYLKDGVELKDGETYVLTVDLTAGVDKAVLKVEKK